MAQRPSAETELLCPKARNRHELFHPEKPAELNSVNLPTQVPRRAFCGEMYHAILMNVACILAGVISTGP
jgi:hypothetical protein